ncbi:stage V sporulation protein AA [Vulcanibacillus modesticaldus]|uniref:Stage V sporulation protein AA n=1 Tax=Vulcanibacillus modesticaldus TaxID=337097 RepID=A0A1D2YSD9_9BACI|nr:stage V sporulation protein AA [Vulcanibacillus modesticaldus]OEF97239.1 stage V sporulation protein AA [Vulcanibacillus modesticaldus]
MGNSVYLRLRNRHYVRFNEQITLSNIAQIIAPESYETRIKNLVVYQVTEEDQHLIVIDLMRIINIIKKEFPELEVRGLGKPEIIVEILTSSMTKKPNIYAVVFVWILLFIGSGLAILNFHHDVSMVEVHRRIYYLITGVEKAKPLILQIPYSIGIGIGMILFFNHVFKKKINEEPSPLEVEMFLYQQNLDQYVVLNENKENRKRQ